MEISRESVCKNNAENRINESQIREWFNKEEQISFKFRDIYVITASIQLTCMNLDLSLLLNFSISYGKSYKKIWIRCLSIPSLSVMLYTSYFGFTVYSKWCRFKKYILSLDTCLELSINIEKYHYIFFLFFFNRSRTLT